MFAEFYNNYYFCINYQRLGWGINSATTCRYINYSSFSWRIFDGVLEKKVVNVESDTVPFYEKLQFIFSFLIAFNVYCFVAIYFFRKF